MDPPLEGNLLGIMPGALLTSAYECCWVPAFGKQHEGSLSYPVSSSPTGDQRELPDALAFISQLSQTATSLTQSVAGHSADFQVLPGIPVAGATVSGSAFC